MIAAKAYFARDFFRALWNFFVYCYSMLIVLSFFNQIARFAR